MGKGMKVSHKLALAAAAAFVLGALATQGLRAAAPPPAYVIVAIDEVTDQEEFQRAYVERNPAGIVEAKMMDGRYLARTQNVIPLDGPAPKFAVILSFPNIEKAKAYNENMKQLTAVRLKVTKSRSFLVEGLPQNR